MIVPEPRTLYAAWPLSDNGLDSGLVVAWQAVQPPDADGPVLVPLVAASCGTSGAFMGDPHVPLSAPEDICIALDLEDAEAQVRADQRERARWRKATA